MLSANESASLRDRLVQEIAASASDEALALWAYRSLPLKNTPVSYTHLTLPTILLV